MNVLRSQPTSANCRRLMLLLLLARGAVLCCVVVFSALLSDGSVVASLSPRVQLVDYRCLPAAKRLKYRLIGPTRLRSKAMQQQRLGDTHTQLALQEALHCTCSPQRLIAVLV